MSQADTKTRILDAAEGLFARDGFHLTSLRALTALAKVNLAAVNYHFGGKEALLQAVIERRLQPLNKIREEKLVAVLAAAEHVKRPPQVEALLRAFIEPTLAFRRSGPGAENFVALIGRSMSDPDPTVRNSFLQQVSPLLLLIVKGLRQALPELPVEILQARLQFTLAAMGQVMCSSDKPLFSPQTLPQPLTDEEMGQQLLRFSLAGLEAPR